MTIPYRIYVQLEQRSSAEGRSISNLCAFLVEIGLDAYPGPNSCPNSAV